MRTTLTLDPDVAIRLRREMRRRGESLKAIVNEGLRKGLGASGPGARPEPFVVEPFHLGGFRPGVDPARLNQLVDELEVEEQLRKSRR